MVGRSDIDIQAIGCWVLMVTPSVSYWPRLADGALMPDYTGIRPKLHGPGEPQPDFRIETAADHGITGLVNLLGIESPGLTSSLAIGDYVAGFA